MIGYKQLVKEIKAAQKGTKVEDDGFMTRYLFRPCSYYYAAFFYKYFHFQPNHISILSGLLGVVTLLLSWYFSNYFLLSFVLFSIACLDNADGSLARYLQKSSPIGSLADAFGGYLIIFTMPIVTWIMLINDKLNITISEYQMGLLTLFLTGFEFLGRNMRLKADDAIQKLTKHSSINAPYTPPSKIKRIQGNLGFCGFMFPFFILSWLAEIPILAWIYIITNALIIGSIGIIFTTKIIINKKAP